MKWLCIGILVFIIIFICCIFRANKKDKGSYEIASVIVWLVLASGTIAFWYLIFRILIKYAF